MLNDSKLGCNYRLNNFVTNNHSSHSFYKNVSCPEDEMLQREFPIEFLLRFSDNRAVYCAGVSFPLIFINNRFLHGTFFS